MQREVHRKVDSGGETQMAPQYRYRGKHTRSRTHTHTHKVPDTPWLLRQTYRCTQSHISTRTPLYSHMQTRHTQIHMDTQTHTPSSTCTRSPLTLGLGSPGGWRQDPQLQGLSLLPTLWRAGLIMGQYHLDSRTLSLHFVWGLLPTEPFPEAGFSACPRAHRRLTHVLDNDTAMFGDQSSLLTKETSPFAFPPSMCHSSFITK